MTYEEGIVSIPKQFEYQPRVVNKEKIRPFQKIILLGMGGSRLAGDILNMYRPDLDIYIHSDYDLPLLSDENLSQALIIANSYSGNTIEVVSGAKMAIDRGFNIVLISTGGELVSLASQNQVPHIVLPHTELPPRMMVGHDLMAIAEIASLDLSELKTCSVIDAVALRSNAIQIARQIGSAIPLVYTSERLNELGYIWKTILNETAKMPAFHNRFPEADHNEIAGFQGDWSSGFHCIFLRDELDARIGKRMDLTADLFRTHNILVATIPLEGASLIAQIVSSTIIAHWTALELAIVNNVDPITVLEIENFKKKLV